MDCEKFDQVIIDAVYDELDELTLAAAKRHTDSCPHCQSAWSGLRATRKIGILPLVEAPAGLETSILQAARDAHRNLPVAKRVGRAISWAGSYAMRPQMAMAALLVLMLGSSIIFLRSKPDRSGALSRISVTERGVPEQAAEEPRTDLKRATGDRAPFGARAKRDEDRGSAATAPMAAAPFAAAPPAEARTAESEGRISKGGLDKAEAADMAAPRARLAAPTTALDDEASSNAGPKVAAAEKKRSDPGGALGFGAGASQGQAPDAYTAAVDLFNTGRYAEAEKAFDDIAASGSKDSGRAALYAARSAEHAFGCGKALKKYEAIHAQYGASSTGPDGLMGAADCYAQLGNYDAARGLYNQLRSVAGYRASAEQKIANLQMLATRRAAPAKKPAAAPPAQAAPKATSTDVMK